MKTWLRQLGVSSEDWWDAQKDASPICEILGEIVMGAKVGRGEGTNGESSE
jgi:hypothetical protein